MVSGAVELPMNTVWYILSVMAWYMYMSFLCVFITPNNLYSLPLEQVGGDFCFYLFLFFFKQFLFALGQHLLTGIIATLFLYQYSTLAVCTWQGCETSVPVPSEQRHKGVCHPCALLCPTDKEKGGIRWGCLSF